MDVSWVANPLLKICAKIITIPVDKLHWTMASFNVSREVCDPLLAHNQNVLLIKTICVKRCTINWIVRILKSFDYI